MDGRHAQVPPGCECLELVMQFGGYRSPTAQATNDTITEIIALDDRHSQMVEDEGYYWGIWSQVHRHKAKTCRPT